MLLFIVEIAAYSTSFSNSPTYRPRILLANLTNCPSKLSATYFLKYIKHVALTFFSLAHEVATGVMGGIASTIGEAVSHCRSYQENG